MYKKIIVGLVLLSLTLTWVFTRLQDPIHFLFIHDEYLLLSKYESDIAFYTQNPIDLGTTNSAALLVTIYERGFYWLAYAVHIPLEAMITISYALKLLIITILPFIGLSFLYQLFHSKKNPILVLLVSLWYSFNPFTLVYWHGNAFSLTLLICYALAPLTFYVYHQAVFNKRTISWGIVATILLFLMSFALYLFAVFVLCLGVYTIILFFLSKKNKLAILGNITRLALLFIPFCLLVFTVFYDMFLNATSTVNITGGETFGMLQGSFLYPLFMWFSWGIYTIWEPRNIYTFHKYFKSFAFEEASVIVYGLILIGMVKQKVNNISIALMSVFLVCLLFIKGPQDPFGQMYLFLYNHFPLFKIFRSPDNKFSFGIVLALAILLLMIIPSYRKKIFVGLLGLVILIQGWLLFTGIAITGENTKTSSDRIVTIPPEYHQVVSIINQDSEYGYVLSLPGSAFDHFKLELHKNHIGQDILAKISSKPFLYAMSDGGISSKAFSQLNESIKSQNVDNFKKFPIRYVLLRKDISEASISAKLKNEVADNYRLIVDNNKLSLFGNVISKPIIEGENVQFERISPVRYRVLIKNISTPRLLTLNQSFNNNWIVLPDTLSEANCQNCLKKSPSVNFGELGYFWGKPLFVNTHTRVNDYANGWYISSSDIQQHLPSSVYRLNNDGTVDVALQIYFKSQSLFYNGVVVSAVYVLFLSLLLIFINIKKYVKK